MYFSTDIAEFDISLYLLIPISKVQPDSFKMSILSGAVFKG